MTDPNVIALSKVSGSRLVAARFDQIGSTSGSMLNLTGMTPNGKISRLATIIVGRDGALTPIWSTVAGHLLTEWSTSVLLSEISVRLLSAQRERIR